MARHHSTENILFWADVQRFKKLKPAERQVAAKDIFNTYFVDNAPLKVNISDFMAEAVLKKVCVKCV